MPETLIEGVIMPPTFLTSKPAPVIFFRSSKALPEIMRDFMGLSRAPSLIVKAFLASTEGVSGFHGKVSGD